MEVGILVTVNIFYCHDRSLANFSLCLESANSRFQLNMNFPNSCFGKYHQNLSSPIIFIKVSLFVYCTEKFDNSASAIKSKF